MELKEIVPVNISGASDIDGQQFFRRLTGRESFNWEGNVRPKCVLLDCIIYKESHGLNTVTGHLMSITADKFDELCDIGISIEGIIEEYKIGWIQINYRTEAGSPSVSIKAYASTYTNTSSTSSTVNSKENTRSYVAPKPATASSSRTSSRSTNSSASFTSSQEKSDRPRWVLIGIILVAVIVTLAGLVTSKPEAPQPTNCYVVKEANLRSYPAKKNNVLLTIPKGTQVTRLEGNGDWVRVRFNNFEGYVRSTLLSSSP